MRYYYGKVYGCLHTAMYVILATKYVAGELPARNTVHIPVTFYRCVYTKRCGSYCATVYPP